MSVLSVAKLSFTAPVMVLMALQGGQVQAQKGQAQKVQAQEDQPVNSGANPYQVIRNWGMEPEGRPWGAANGVAIDRDGMSVWVADRCGNGTGCVGSSVDPIQKFDQSGKRLTSFGGGMFVWPHGLHVDRDGNIWLADSRRPTAEELKSFPRKKTKAVWS
jgi:hypothetical protein